jgi:hypothetical protein
LYRLRFDCDGYAAKLEKWPTGEADFASCLAARRPNSDFTDRSKRNGDDGAPRRAAAGCTSAVAERLAWPAIALILHYC